MCLTVDLKNGCGVVMAAPGGLERTGGGHPNQTAGPFFRKFEWVRFFAPLSFGQSPDSQNKNGSCCGPT
jgi:hypothetical protein